MATLYQIGGMYCAPATLSEVETEIAYQERRLPILRKTLEAAKAQGVEPDEHARALAECEATLAGLQLALRNRRNRVDEIRRNPPSMFVPQL